MPRTVIIEKKNGTLGMELGRYEGGPLYVETIASNGAAEKSGVPLNWSLIRVGQYNVFNVRTLLDALDSQKGADKVEMVFGEDMSAKIEAARKIEARSKNPMFRLTGFQGFSLGGRKSSRKSISSRASDSSKSTEASPSPRSTRSGRSKKALKRSGSASSGASSPSSPLLPMSFLEEDIPSMYESNRGTYTPPVIACA
eukprot:TRINITY_DN1670_c1_g3_i1.p2 TRINITY_DN1670_c1_g3~~TRINITY_DN1670_c1_g3_i1.p2  ORF type:complete len:198 (+),score=66.02 TRINITY_DN1670_c1_g3_i1:496-1089(+)